MMAAPRKPSKSDALREQIARQGEGTQETPERGTPDPQRGPYRGPRDPGKTPARNIRIPDHDWSALQDAAADEGTSAGAVVRRLVRDYLRKRGAV
jgi:hypothetical protein